MSLLEDIKPIIEKNNYSFLPELYGLFARIQNNLGDHKMSSFYLKKQAKIYKQQGDSKQVALAYNKIATEYHSLDNIDSTLLYLNLGLNINLFLKDSLNIIESYKRLGSTYMEISAIKKADSIYSLALNYDVTATILSC